ncbi:hypothetical protein A6F59_25445 [Prescottella equi]|nr:hypothetical protein A6F59_25445 [Prescottella equi]
MLQGRNHTHTPMTWSNTVASTRLRVRRIIDSDGGRPSIPSRPSAFAGALWTHSAIAVNDLAPAHTAANTTDRITVSR